MTAGRMSVKNVDFQTLMESIASCSHEIFLSRYPSRRATNDTYPLARLFGRVNGSTDSISQSSTCGNRVFQVNWCVFSWNSSHALMFDRQMRATRRAK